MQQETQTTGLEIAVIGMAGRFPGASRIRQFWDNLTRGVESISFFSPAELEEEGISSAQAEHPDYIGARGIVAEGDCFDASFFDYSQREAEVMDPQVRLFHECAWEALEDAGCNPRKYPGLIGMFAGASPNLYWEGLTAISGRGEKLGSFAAVFQSDKDFLSLLLSYKLNLRGPVFTFYTACSTSLAAVHLGCRALLTGECHMVLCGGVTLTLPQQSGYRYQEGLIFSSDGHCRVFDRRASGTLGGNGVGVVVLKPLPAALEEGDYIYAVIKGSAVNNDGDRRVGFTAPGIDGQADVITRALHMSEVEPVSICYIEAHGTGTALGDPVEIEALKLAYGSVSQGACGLGSVKSNIGHLDCAAGIAGFIKAVLILAHKTVPPTLHFESPNLKIDLKNTPFYMNRSLQHLESGAIPLRVGVSSFGMGGTNAHVILEEAPRTGSTASTVMDAMETGPAGKEASEARDCQLLLLSAVSEEALSRQGENLAAFLREHPELNLADAAYTLQEGRKHFRFRRKLVCSNVEEAVTLLNSPDPRSRQSTEATEEKKTVVFMFPGLGAQYVNMGLELYCREPVFRAEMDRCFEILDRLADFDLKALLYPGLGERNRSNSSGSPDLPDLSRFDVAQAAMFGLQYALARLLMAWGIEPDAMIGYSFGEYTAACLSGVFTPEGALTLILERGRLLEQVPAGGMLSVPLPRERVQELLQEAGAELALAIDNGDSCIVSGAEAAVDAFAGEMKQKKLVCLRLKTSYGLHSPLLAPVSEAFTRAAAGISRQAPQVPYISNVTGTWIRAGEAVKPEYWSRHLCSTVLFGEGIGHLLERPNPLLIEVGPERELCTLLNAHLSRLSRADVFQPVNLVRHPQQQVSDTAYLLNKVGQLWLYGLEPGWAGFYPGQRRQKVSLPTYPFERQQYPMRADRGKKAGTGASPSLSSSSRLEKKPDIGDWFYRPTWRRSSAAGQPGGVSLKAMKPGRWLVFAPGSADTVDSEAPGQKLCGLLMQRLRQAGHEVLEVRRGSEFARQGENLYGMDAGEETHYRQLLETLSRESDREKDEDLPLRVVHFWSVTGSEGAEVSAGEPESQDFERSLVPGFYSLIYLARTLSRLGVTGTMDLRVVTDHLCEVTGGEELLPHKAPILGPLKVIPQEYPFIRCGQVDLDVPEPGSAAEAELVEQLLEEFSDPAPEPMVALRNRYRWLPGFEPVALDRVGEGAAIAGLKKEGVYLISGGLGKIGLTLGSYLVEQVGARVVLTGRRDLPPEDQWERILAEAPAHDGTVFKIRLWQQIQAGANRDRVMRFAADVTDLEGMREVIARAEEAWGPLTGVIHAAGDTRQTILRSIEQLTPADCRQQFLPKIRGLLTLEKAVRGKPLEFFWLTSSLSPLLGGLGLTSYSAANHFLDAFARRMSRGRRENPELQGGAGQACRWLSVNWADWNFAGEAGNPSPESRPGQEKAGEPRPEEWHMSPGEGVETFQRILSYCRGPQVAVSTVDLPARIERWVALKSVRESQPAGTRESRETPEVAYRSRPPLENLYEKPSSTMEQAIADILQDFLGIAEVGIHDNFFELGATSLNIIQINTLVREKLQQDLSVMWWFEYPTIKLLTAHLAEAAGLEVPVGPVGSGLPGEPLGPAGEPLAEHAAPGRTAVLQRGKGKLGQLKRKGEKRNRLETNNLMEEHSDEPG
jgi:acyl transferase domain-containing protein/acyl carrier protein